MLQAPIDTNEIVITAARAPEQAENSAASVVVIEKQRIERLGEPLLPALLRLIPSTSVSTSGPAGSLTQVRIRGAEASHTLLFVDGIRANDPASINEPHWELLNADLASRLEVVRGPQSALWGSEAIGGVVAVYGLGEGASAPALAGEAGSFGFRRVSVSAGVGSGDANAALAVGWQRSDGIDIFGGGDRDGYRNLSGRLRASWQVSPALEVGVAGFSLNGRNQFDGNDPATFARTHDLSSRNALHAGRIWADFATDSWKATASASLLGSLNRNAFASDEINRTRGRRQSLSGQVEHRFATGALAHQLVAAFDLEQEEFRARDTVYGGLTDQDRDRRHQALTVEWRGEAGPLIANVAVRRDGFNRFEDSTTLRASALLDIGRGFALAASYGEGIAQPRFSDLYGFFPGNFVGNASLKPEISRGVEASLRYRSSHLQAALTGYRQRLRDEIVGTFDSTTFLTSTINRDGRSRRSGIEAEVGWQLGDTLRLTANYAYLKASEPDGASQIREVRRPKHSGSVAIDGASGRLTYGASLAFTGSRTDMNFDVFPSQSVRLGSYWLGGARIAYGINRRFELLARAANAFDERYHDVFGYRTEGRRLYAG
ncbi:MAG: TonB-dependent receptor plug domain-containing protein, partial [Sphingomicrobium sp.]